MPLVLGITGGIATGKSTVARILAELGAQVISADQISREVMAKDTPVYHDVVARFGQGILTPNGDIDRAALAQIVFSDAKARRDLEHITHPRIISCVQEIIDEFRANPPSPRAVLVAEIPLLYECSLANMVDKVVVVAAEQETQVRRLTTGCRISRDEAFRRIGAQMPVEQKARLADWVVHNDGTVEELKQSVRGIWEKISLL